MKKPKGFTLVELLVVIAIIALLLAILMPALNKAKTLAKTVVCGNNIKMFGIANQMYATECDGMCVPFNIFTDETQKTWGPFGQPWFMNPLFSKYMAYDSRTIAKSTSGSTINFALDRKFLCPGDGRRDDEFYKDALQYIKISYGMNFSGLTINWKWPKGYNGYKLSKIPQPATKIAFMDTIAYQLHEIGADYVTWWDKWHETNGAVSGGWACPAYRHQNESAQVGFFDGHIELRKKQDCFFYLGTANLDGGRAMTPDKVRNDQIWRPGKPFD